MLVWALRTQRPPYCCYCSGGSFRGLFSPSGAGASGAPGAPPDARRTFRSQNSRTMILRSVSPDGARCWERDGQRRRSRRRRRVLGAGRWRIWGSRATWSSQLHRGVCAAQARVSSGFERAWKGQMMFYIHMYYNKETTSYIVSSLSLEGH